MRSKKQILQMPKEKKCRCGNRFTQYLTTQTKCTTCLIKKGSEITRKEWNKERKVLKEKLKSLPEYKSDARAMFQKWVRMRDKHLPCISCEKTEAKQWDGGHYLKAEIYSGLIFHEDNCHKQCSYCNDYLAGNPLDYRNGLIKRITLRKVIQLEEIADLKRVYKYSKEELVEIKSKYSALIKEYEKQK